MWWILGGLVVVLLIAFCFRGSNSAVGYTREHGYCPNMGACKGCDLCEGD